MSDLLLSLLPTVGRSLLGLAELASTPQ